MICPARLFRSLGEDSVPRQEDVITSVFPGIQGDSKVTEEKMF
jgi:hypothetical protein